MMYVLDTNVLSELRKVRLGKADPNVAAWAENVDATSLFVSAITMMELELGMLSVERRDATQGAMLRAWLEQAVFCPSSPSAFCLSTPQWHNAARGCTSPTSAVSATRSLQRQRWCMA